MKITLKSYLITFISLFIFQESVNAGECYGKVIGGPFSGKENIQISKFLEKSSFAIYSLLNIDLNVNPELASENLRIVAKEIGNITNVIDVEEILDDIFNSFCIGK